MRIIKGHDYYDGAGMGYDPVPVFVRDQVEIPWEGTLPGLFPGNRSYGDPYLEFAYVLIGGETHPLLMENVCQSTSPYFRIYCHYGEKIDVVLEDWKVFERIKRSWWPDRSDDITAWKETRLDQHLLWCISKRVVTGIVQGENHDKRRVVMTGNTDNLKTVEFARCVPPPLAFQKIEQFLGGVLSNNQPIDPLPNDQRIVKAGFDTKQSFRHRT